METTRNYHEIDLQALRRSIEDIKFLKRTATFLTNLSELSRLVFGLNSGKCIVIDEHGRIYTGKVKLERLTELPQKLPGKPMEATPPAMDSRWLVEVHGKSFTNSWDGMLRIPEEITCEGISQFQIILFRRKFEEAPTSRIHKHFLSNHHGHSMVKISIEGHKIECVFCCHTGNLKFAVKDGKEYPVYFKEILRKEKVVI